MVKIIGHRGAAGIELENSASSIKAALKLPIDGIEFDVRRTKDGKLIVLHDWHTGRVATEKLFVLESTLAELQALKLKNGQHIMTLDETLGLIGDSMPIVLDVKDFGVSEELERTLKKFPKLSITISSRKYNELQSIHHLMPELPFLAQSHVSPTDVAYRARQIHATGIAINKWLLNPATYHLAKRFKLEVGVYTVNSSLLARLITRLYPDITIYTDHPERFIRK